MNLADQPARTITKAQQLHSKRQKPRRKTATRFSGRTRRAIIERDNGLCVRCKKPYRNIHHVIFASAMGRGTEDNGVCVCRKCHEWAHNGREGREWFEQYRERNLLT